MILISVLILLFITLLAGWLPLYTHKKNIKIDLLLSFSSGTLIAMAFIHMLPLSIEKLQGETGTYILIGFLFLFLLEKFIMVHPCQEDDCHAHHLGISAFVGLSIHCFISGLSVGIALISAGSFREGFPFLFAFVLHKIPESLMLASLLAKSRFKEKNRYLLIFAFSIFAPLGVLISDYSLHHLINSSLNLLLGISTGTFIYIASSDILPNIHKEDKKKWIHMVIFAAGVILMMLL